MAIRTSILSCCAALSLFLASPAIAELRVVTVDVNEIVNRSPQGQKLKKDLQQSSQAAKTKLEAKRKSLKETEKKLAERSVKDDSEQAVRFRSEIRDFERLAKDTDEELREKFMKANRAVAETTLKAVADYARKNKIDLVLDKSRGARGGVLYGSPEHDITDEVIATLPK